MTPQKLDTTPPIPKRVPEITRTSPNREKFRGSEHFFWDYILNTRKANALRRDHKKNPFFSFFSFFFEIIQLKSKPENHPHIINI